MLANVFMNPACFPVIERTWIRDLTQSTGNTTNHNEIPPNPPLIIKGRIPGERKKMCLITMLSNHIHACSQKCFIILCNVYRAFGIKFLFFQYFNSFVFKLKLK